MLQSCFADFQLLKPFSSEVVFQAFKLVNCFLRLGWAWQYHIISWFGCFMEMFYVILECGSLKYYISIKHPNQLIMSAVSRLSLRHVTLGCFLILSHQQAGLSLVGILRILVVESSSKFNSHWYNKICINGNIHQLIVICFLFYQGLWKISISIQIIFLDISKKLHRHITFIYTPHINYFVSNVSFFKLIIKFYLKKSWMYQEFSRNVSGMYLECVWNVSGKWM
jgi:hypothetical protein